MEHKAAAFYVQRKNAFDIELVKTHVRLVLVTGRASRAGLLGSTASFSILLLQLLTVTQLTLFTCLSFFFRFKLPLLIYFI